MKRPVIEYRPAVLVRLLLSVTMYESGAKWGLGELEVLRMMVVYEAEPLLADMERVAQVLPLTESEQAQLLWLMELVQEARRMLAQE